MSVRPSEKARAASALKRVATEANGWFPVGIPLSEVGAMFDGIKDMARAAGP
jgi:hypothetical protein